MNFGRNLTFRPTAYLVPRTEDDVLRILAIHRGKNIRAIGRLHSWSEAPRADEVLIDLRHLNHVRVEQQGDDIWATIGAGCQIKRVLAELERQANATLPSIGLITEQTIAGAISTGTHGSGKHSLSHYVAEVRLAIYDPETGRPAYRVVREGVELLAARCSLGCMGIIVSVKFRCRPSYMIEEHIRDYATLNEVLAAEQDYPLQQFFLIPWSWRFMAQHRREVDVPRSWLAPVYRAYWFLGVDVGLHVWIQLMVKWLRSSRAVRFFYRWVLPLTVVYRWRVVDKSHEMLVMKHELFRHIEIEMFVNRTRLAEVVSFVQDVLSCFGEQGTPLSDSRREQLAGIGLLDFLLHNVGKYTHHYPICIRRVLPDDTLISMASGEGDPWYAISFISYARPNERAGFLAFANFMAKSMVALFGARPHWGKICLVDSDAIAGIYPRLEEFRQVCSAFDQAGVFRNGWTASLLFSVGDRPEFGHS